MHALNILPTTSDDTHHDNKITEENSASIERLIAHFRQDLDIDATLLEIELLLLALAIGIQDAISFPDFHCFASNQTGNTVLFAVGVLLNRSSNTGDSREQEPMFSVATIAVSLGFFILGCWMTGQTANYFNAARNRGWLVLSNALSTVLVYVAAALQWYYSNRVGPDTGLGRIIVGLLAFSSGSQVAVVRGLKITDITTAMATAAYIDIFIDPRLFAKLSENRGRNRRILFLLMLVVGSFIGAGVGARTDFSVAVLISAIVKTCVTLLFVCSKERREGH
ncbi:Nn.00g039120.m01.CDS01 [Neocucurbitaria sp. VM-36]